MIDNEELLQAVDALRDEWPVLLGSDADTIDTLLAEARQGDVEADRQAANRILAILSEYPEAQARIAASLEIPPETFRYHRLPGTDSVPATKIMVCPVDPEHYQQQLRQLGQFLFCPEHDVALIEKQS